MVTVLPQMSVDVWSENFHLLFSRHADHMSLLATVYCSSAFMNVLSAFFCRLEVINWTSWGTKVNLAQFASLTSKIHRKYNFGQRHMKKSTLIHYKQYTECIRVKPSAWSAVMDMSVLCVLSRSAHWLALLHLIWKSCVMSTDRDSITSSILCM
jgi:hypothetical protein